jgi:S-(hydroxymethyl)glutathione dehydrogenase / alcohol dehydrogenase
MKAAVLHAYNQPITIEELEIPAPQNNEVLVKMAACGICHSDYSAMIGQFPVPTPTVLGHEGAGIVEKVGPGVTKVKPGDHVICYAMPHCGKCRQCEQGRHTLCEVAGQTAFGGTMMDGTLRLKTKTGQPVHSFFAQSAWAEYAVIEESAAVKAPAEAPLDQLCLLSCGVSTGLGAVINRAKVKPGGTAAIFGMGGVGLGALMACTLSGASRIYAIDLVDQKLDLARQLGATDTVNSSRENLLERITRETGGVDYAFECIGNTKVMAIAYECTATAGTMVIVGGAPRGQMLSLNADSFLVTQKTVTGCSACGGTIGDIATNVTLFMSGKLPLHKLIGQNFTLAEINEALAFLNKGAVGKAVIKF